MQMKWMNVFLIFTFVFLSTGWMPVFGEDEPKSNVTKLDDVIVKEQAGAPGFKPSPSKTEIEVDTITTIGPPNSVIDVLKNQAIIDFRGQSELDPGVDSIYMRGYDARRFATAIDGLTVQKTGGRKSSNIVDYALLPTFLIDSVEVLPGPHSALYDAKSVGGVLNMKTKAPTRHETLKPDVKLSASYGTYNTQSYNAIAQGSMESFTYDMAYRNYSTDGYLRNDETSTDIMYCRLGYILPSNGYVTFSSSFSDVERQAAVNNPGETQTGETDYDSDRPVVKGSVFEPWQKTTWDGDASNCRLNYAQSLPIGRLQLGIYAGEDTRDRSYLDWVDKNDHTLGIYRTSMETDWWQEGGKFQDDIEWNENHTTTIGYDHATLYDEGVDDSKTKRIRKNGAFVQHRWGILPSLETNLGVRYEDLKTWVSNWSNNTYHNSAYNKYVKRNFDELIPKSFTTWKMDGLAPWMRDTSLSAGISKIWRAPDYHGDYNPQGRPAGITLEPEHGIGYDLVLDRRLWQDITFKVNYAFYEIEDYIARNSKYAEHSGKDEGALRYSDYKINLEKVYRHGVDMELGGHLTNDLSFYLTYSWQKFNNKGNEPAAETELHQRAENRLSTGLRYVFLKNTTLMMDYYYQSEETTEVAKEIFPDEWHFTEAANDAYNVFDIGVRYVLFKKTSWFRNGALSVYIKNLFDETYYNASGYPATDRTFGASFSIGI